MSLTLKRITEEQMSLFRQIEDNEGEITPEIEAGLAITAQDVQRKTAGYVDFINELENRESVIDKEIKRLQNMKKAAKNLRERLEGNLLWAVKTFGVIKTDYHKVSLSKGESVIVENEAAVPDAYKVVKMDVQIDKVALKKAVKDGLVPTGNGISIRVSESLKIS